MQQFTVPQFIDVEDKIIGPITVRQFIIILASCLFAVAAYRIFTFSAFLVISIIVFGIAAVFAFYRVNGMPFHFFVLNFFQTFSRPTLRVWNLAIGKIETEFINESEAKKDELKTRKQDRRVGGSRLAELSLIVDTSGKFKGGEE
ncbi:MAG: PrgI family protein [Candidatus Falkowbacteria bacterium]|nr:PrgI family protein [Candidatus Falkowbacteria bacterium]